MISPAHSVTLPCLLSCILLCTLSCTAWSADDGYDGRIRVQGAIFDAPCTIDMASNDQSVEIVDTVAGQRAHNVQEPQRPFRIRLVSCLQTLQQTNPVHPIFRVSFESPVTRDNLAETNSQASDAGFQITDSTGTVAIPGKLSMPAWQSETAALDYTLRLTGNQKALHASTYRTIIRFTLDYF